MFLPCRSVATVRDAEVKDVRTALQAGTVNGAGIASLGCGRAFPVLTVPPPVTAPGAALVLRSDPAGPGALRLDPQLDLAAAHPLAEACLARRGADLVVDASTVRRVGGLCLQVLLAAAETWRGDGHRLVFHAPTPDFVDGLELMGALPAGARPAPGELS